MKRRALVLIAAATLVGGCVAINEGCNLAPDYTPQFPNGSLLALLSFRPRAHDRIFGADADSVLARRIAADDQRFVMVRRVRNAGTGRVVLVRNWVRELERAEAQVRRPRG